MNKPKKIELLNDYQFNELDNYARIPRGTTFEVLYWQGINGESCPVVDGNPYVNSSIYFRASEWKPFSKNQNPSFLFEGQEYWEYMPHSRGNSVRTSHLRFINGVLYQWLQGMSRDSGIWLKVPNITINEDQKEKVETNRSSTETDEKGI